MNLNCKSIGKQKNVRLIVYLKNMKKENSETKQRHINRVLLAEPFIKYIEYMYFPGAIEVLDDRLISFEFENFKSFYLN